MKRINFFVITLFSCFHVNSQNWLPINQNHIYNYEFSNDRSITSLWVDSVDIVNNDTTLFINKVYKQSADKLYLYLNESSFLLSQFTMINNLVNFYDSKTNISYKLILNDTSLFVFDSVNNIMAHCISKNDSVLWSSVHDSVNTFILSNSDTVIISRNHGILKFPTFQNHEHYKLVGIENSFGTQIPMFIDFFNFNIGDIFEYHTNEGAGSYPSYDINAIMKITIVNKIVHGDSLLYICNKKQRVIAINYILQTYDTSYSEKIDTLLYINYLNSFINKYSCDTISINVNFANPVNLYYNTKYECLTKYFGGYYGLPYLNYMNDTMIYSYYYGIDLNPFPIYLEDIAPFPSWWNNFYDNKGLSYLYGEGLGLVEKECKSTDMGPHGNFSYSLNLKAAQTQNRNFGTFTNDSLLVSVTQIHDNAELFVYPNPAHNYLVLENWQLRNNFILSICDINGRELIKQQIYYKKTQVDFSNLSKGVYFVRLITDKFVKIKKIVKE